ncbi:MAG: hypothetical protein OXR03_16515 [Rhodospirillaceae bacterium]|nr:hypothetical protein [Rhodospirillaceae bacterium]
MKHLSVTSFCIALALALFGATSAEACSTYLNIKNNTGNTIKIIKGWTQKKGSGKWIHNSDVTFVASRELPDKVLQAGNNATWKRHIVTHRKKKTDFRFKVRYKKKSGKKFGKKTYELTTGWAKCKNGHHATAG